MASFETYFPKLIQFEGGYVNNINDKGGRTKYGITEDEWRQYGDGRDISMITVHDASNIAKKIYWNGIKGDLINNQSIADFLCDFAYNSGTGTAIKKLQTILGVTVDLIIGPNTLAALNDGNQEGIFDSLKQSRIDFVYAIAKNNPSRGIFLKGRLNRINSFKFTA